MALIQCPDCQTEVSDAAASCTKCGRVREPSAFGQFAKGLLLVFNAAMAVWFIVEVTSVLPQTSRVMVPWAAGSVILGMLALVYQRPQRRRGTEPPRDAQRKESGNTVSAAFHEDPVMSRAIARRYARGEGLIGKPQREQQGGRGTEPPTDEAGRGCQNPDDQPGNDRPRHEMDGASI